MKFFILTLLFLTAVIIETTLIQLPLVMLLLLIATIIYRSEWVFIISTVLGVLVDSLLFRQIGQTSLFYLFFVLGIFWYEQKFELRTVPFVSLMSCIGGLCYFLLFGSQMLILQTIVTGIIGVLIFLAFTVFEKPPQPKYYVG